MTTTPTPQLEPSWRDTEGGDPVTAATRTRGRHRAGRQFTTTQGLLLGLVIGAAFWLALGAVLWASFG